MTHLHPFYPLFVTAYEYIEQTLNDAFVCPEFSQMLGAYRQKRAGGVGMLVDVWPTVCCQTFGGNVEYTLPVTAAWVLSILAGRIFDDLLDGEGEEHVWRLNGRCQPVPTGLQALGTANLLLTQIPDSGKSQGIVRAFAQVLREAAVAEENRPAKNEGIASYFRHIAAKTGAVFATGAWSGVQVGLMEPDAATLSLMHSFGAHIGMMIQIKDDCDDLVADLTRQIYTLPVLYALSLVSHPAQEELQQLLPLSGNPERASAVAALVTEMGAVTWSLRVAAAYQMKAFELLENTPSAEINLVQAYALF
jgi:geranylgeranyl pyrophosphate synthase